MKTELLPNFNEDLYICAQCSFCTTACETIGYTLWESNTPKGRMFALKELLEGKLDGKNGTLASLADSAFSCTLCGRCEAVCQTDIKLRSLWLQLRTELLNRGHFPKKLSLMRDGIDETGNVASYPNEERASWTDFVEDVPDHGFQKEKADVVYFVGCMSSFSPAISSIPESFAQLLHKAEVDFTIMGEKEMCCTYPLLVGGFGGDKKLVEKLRDANVEAFKSTGATEMVFTCPSCYMTWKEDYLEQYGLDLKLYHSTQYVNRLIDEGKVKLKKTDVKVSYHDPCDLGRNSNEYEAPRKLLRSTGAELLEPAQNREVGLCCGGGGDVEVYDPDLATYMSSATVRAFDETGADITLTACQQCQRTFQSTAKKINSPMKYMDITEFVLGQME